MDNDKIERLRREVRADLELTWAGQADSNKRLTEIASTLDIHGDKIEEQGQRIAEQGQRIAEQGRQIAEQGRQIAASMRDTARLGREVAATGDTMVGRLRQFDQRFGLFLDAVQDELISESDRIDSLEKRVRRLEEGHGPAA